MGILSLNMYKIHINMVILWENNINNWQRALKTIRVSYQKAFKIYHQMQPIF